MNRMRVVPALLAMAMLVPELVHAETVVARRRMGNNVEAATYDPVNDRALAMDGNDVIAIALNPLDAAVLATMHVNDGGISGIGFRKLFDVTALDPLSRTPRGIVYVPAQHRYYYTGFPTSTATLLFSSDENGHPLPTLNLKGLGDVSSWLQWEGLAWIPPGAPVHGGTIAGIGHPTQDGIAHVYFIRLDGTVEGDVLPEPGTPLENYFCGIQYWPQHPGTVLLSDCGLTGTYAMDMRSGALVGDPSKPLAPPPEAVDVEGIIVRNNGEILQTGYQTGRLYAYDSSFRRTPGDDHLFVVGLGVGARRLAWNSDTAELVALTAPLDEVFAISPDLRSARRLFDVDVNHELGAPFGLAYLGQGTLAVTDRAVRGIDVADITTGYSLSRLIFQGADFPPGWQGFNPFGVGAYGPDMFLVNVKGDTSALKVVSRTGTPDTSIYPDGVIPTRYPDLVLSVPTQGIEAQVFNSGTGQRIFTGAEIYDGSGKLIHVIDGAKLGLQNGPPSNGVWMYGNTFATVDGATNTIVVYTVP